jgi:murein DD-endopeptidase MepM/ murein hydrolase activator NlpD
VPKRKLARTLSACLAIVAALPAAGVAAPASSSGGGAMFFETPKITKVKCVKRCATSKRVQGGSTVRIAGRSLGKVTEATFYGTTGSADDVRTKVTILGTSSARVRVPRKAVTGPIRVRTSEAVDSPPASLVILPPLPAEVLASKSHVFPIQGKHDFGGAGARFGSGRAGHTHQGHDVFAACGTPLVAARGGTVQAKKYHSAAGNYLVIDGDGTGVDYAYMHLAEPSPFEAGDEVVTGQRIGSVGDTGDAVGCHLHFEMWTAPGWYEGGRPFDPLRALKAWDAWS